MRERIADAEAAGLVVTDVAVEFPAGGVGVAPSVDQSAVDQHVEAISAAIRTVRSLDEHYGREVDGIAAQLHSAIPEKVDRSPIQGPDNPWVGRGVDAMTGAVMRGFPAFADELDPETRGKHKLNPVPDDVGRASARELRLMGRIAGPLGSGVTIYDGVRSYAEGESSAGEAVAGTTGALAGGFGGGLMAGAVAGSFLGPFGTLIGAGAGAVGGAYFGRMAGDKVYEEIFDDRTEG